MTRPEQRQQALLAARLLRAVATERLRTGATRDQVQHYINAAADYDTPRSAR